MSGSKRAKRVPKQVKSGPIRPSRDVRITDDTTGTVTVRINWQTYLKPGHLFPRGVTLPPTEREVDVQIVRKALNNDLIREGDFYPVIEPGTYEGMEVRVQGSAAIIGWNVAKSPHDDQARPRSR